MILWVEKTDIGLLIFKSVFRFFGELALRVMLPISLILSMQSASMAYELPMREVDFGEVSVSIPSSWYLHDEAGIQNIMRQAEARHGKLNPNQRRLLVGNDRQHNAHAVVRLSTLPSNKELSLFIEEAKTANFVERMAWAEDFLQESRKSVVIKKVYPIEIETIGRSNIPAALIHYDRLSSVNSKSIWYVQIYQFYGKLNNYIFTISYDRNDKNAAEVVENIKNLIRLK